MKDAFLLLLQSRKALVGIMAIGSAVIVALGGMALHAPTETILALIGSIVGIVWKLIDAIASEDNSKRLASGFRDGA